MEKECQNKCLAGTEEADAGGESVLARMALSSRTAVRQKRGAVVQGWQWGETALKERRRLVKEQGLEDLSFAEGGQGFHLKWEACEI